MTELSHPQLTPTDAARLVFEIDATLTPLRAHERRLTGVKTALTARLAEVDARIATGRDTVVDGTDRADLREALSQLDRGPRATEGTLPEVSPFVGLRGLTSTHAEIARLTEERAHAVLMRDHGMDVAEYRLKQNVGAHYCTGPDGQPRRLMPGETTQLTLRSYHAFEDKFEPVESTTTPAPVDSSTPG